MQYDCTRLHATSWVWMVEVFPSCLRMVIIDLEHIYKYLISIIFAIWTLWKFMFVYVQYFIQNIRYVNVKKEYIIIEKG